MFTGGRSDSSGRRLPATADGPCGQAVVAITVPMVYNPAGFTTSFARRSFVGSDLYGKRHHGPRRARAGPQAAGHVHRLDGLAGLHHLVWEVLDNAVDEALNGFCTAITLRIEKDGGVTVIDNAAASPWTSTRRRSGRHRDHPLHAPRGRQVRSYCVPVLGRSARRGRLGGERAFRGLLRPGVARWVRVDPGLLARKPKGNLKKGKPTKGPRHGDLFQAGHGHLFQDHLQRQDHSRCHREQGLPEQGPQDHRREPAGRREACLLPVR